MSNNVEEKESNKPIVVVGAGLSGCCIALLLSKIFKKRKIILFESRDDYRKELKRINTLTSSSSSPFGQFDNAATRSINLALSYRGISALKECDLYNDIIKNELLILMKGRFVHLDNNVNSKQLYGQDHQGIYSISRLTLNCLFLDKLLLNKNVECRFNQKITKILSNGTVIYNENKSKLSSYFVLGCDGVYSATRASLQRLGRYNFSMKYINHGYKELTIFPDKNGKFKIEENYLHIWPKHELMLIGLPNPDKTFTCTLFAPWDFLQTLTNEKQIESSFQKYFPSFIPLCPNYIDQCIKNPTSPLAHISLNKWNHKNRILLLGDSAHAIVPFYGQGMNAALEDCLILYELFKQKGFVENDSDDDDDNATLIENIFNEFSSKRQPSTEALSQLSLQNYVEMRSLTAKKWFVYKKKFEKTLNFFAPSVWRPIYSMVAFSRTPYDDAIERAKKQDRYLSVALSSTAFISIATLAAIGYKYDIFGVIKSKFNKNNKL